MNFKDLICQKNSSLASLDMNAIYLSNFSTLTMLSISPSLISGLLESAISCKLAARILLEVVGKNQGFMLISNLHPKDLIGHGGEP